jgi:hypothetical protein|nr:MAG TPA: hypothetical protein [Caudoviricetes sp.]
MKLCKASETIIDLLYMHCMIIAECFISILLSSSGNFLDFYEMLIREQITCPYQESSLRFIDEKVVIDIFDFFDIPQESIAEVAISFFIESIVYEFGFYFSIDFDFAKVFPFLSFDIERYEVLFVCFCPEFYFALFIR